MIHVISIFSDMNAMWMMTPTADAVPGTAVTAVMPGATAEDLTAARHVDPVTPGALYASSVTTMKRTA